MTERVVRIIDVLLREPTPYVIVAVKPEDVPGDDPVMLAAYNGARDKVVMMLGELFDGYEQAGHDMDALMSDVRAYVENKA